MGELIFKGEGTLEFTAYWPYAKLAPAMTMSLRSTPSPLTQSPLYGETELEITLSNSATTTATIDNQGSIPSPFYLNSTTPLSKIAIGSEEVTGEDITYWNSQTGIVKSGASLIDYTGNGLCKIPVGGTEIVLTHGTGKQGQKVTIKYDYWYY